MDIDRVGRCQRTMQVHKLILKMVFALFNYDLYSIETWCIYVCIAFIQDAPLVHFEMLILMFFN